MIPIDIHATHDYKSVFDKDEPQVVFKLGYLDVFTRAFLDDKFSDDKGQIQNKHARFLEFARYGLKGWDWKDVPFITEEVDMPGIGKKTIVSNETMSKLSLEVAIEIGFRVIASNFVIGDEIKN